MTHQVPWTRLIRFESTDGRILRGEPIIQSEGLNSTDHDFDLGMVTEADKLQARVISGDDIYDTTGRTKVTDIIVSVKRILGPLNQKDVPILRCVGLNYAKHSKSITHSTPCQCSSVARFARRGLPVRSS